jgi:hypothetical protein
MNSWNFDVDLIQVRHFQAGTEELCQRVTFHVQPLLSTQYHLKGLMNLGQHCDFIAPFRTAQRLFRVQRYQKLGIYSL